LKRNAQEHLQYKIIAYCQYLKKYCPGRFWPASLSFSFSLVAVLLLLDLHFATPHSVTWRTVRVKRTDMHRTGLVGFPIPEMPTSRSAFEILNYRSTIFTFLRKTLHLLQKQCIFPFLQRGNIQKITTTTSVHTKFSVRQLANHLWGKLS